MSPLQALPRQQRLRLPGLPRPGSEARLRAWELTKLLDAKVSVMFKESVDAGVIQKNRKAKDYNRSEPQLARHLLKEVGMETLAFAMARWEWGWARAVVDEGRAAY